MEEVVLLTKKQLMLRALCLRAAALVEFSSTDACEEALKTVWAFVKNAGEHNHRVDELLFCPFDKLLDLVSKEVDEPASPSSVPARKKRVKNVETTVINSSSSDEDNSLSKRDEAWDFNKARNLDFSFVFPKRVRQHPHVTAVDEANGDGIRLQARPAKQGFSFFSSVCCSKIK
jgi:hypothetical protein